MFGQNIDTECRYHILLKGGRIFKSKYSLLALSVGFDILFIVPKNHFQQWHVELIFTKAYKHLKQLLSSFMSLTSTFKSKHHPMNKSYISEIFKPLAKPG